MDMNKKWKTLAIVSTCLLILVSFLYAQSLMSKKAVEPEPINETVENETSEPEQAKENWLSLWNDDATAKKELVAFMEDITNESSPNYIPVEKRVAVFDLDGTLFCETDPIYFDWYMYTYRVLNDTDYKDKASEEDIQLAKDILKANIHDLPDDIEERHCVRNPAVFANMSMEDYANYIKNYLNRDAPGYNNMKRGDAFYKPMLEVISYLQKNDFTVYIVSGTDRFEIRTIVEGKINIPESQIIGSVSTVKASGQGNKNGTRYQFQKNDTVILGGGFVIKNVKMNKVNTMTTEIGKKPVLSFGNSSGDKSMATYVTSNNKYKSLAFQLCCDDEERENGNVTKAEIMRNLCKENNWEAISMKNDWKTIYGDNVSRKK